MNKYEQRVIETKQKIKNALVKMLEETSIEKISIKKLCEIAEVNRATFYNHYGSQFDVLEDVAATFLDGTSNAIMADLMDGKNVSDGLRAVLTYISQNKEFAYLLVSQNSSDIISNVKVKIPHFDEIFISRLPKDMEEEKKKAIVSFVIYGATRLLVEWVIDGCQKSPKDEAKLMLWTIEFMLKDIDKER